MPAVAAQTPPETSPKTTHTLSLTPNKCVALRKGRECFATIQVVWQAAKSGHFCLQRHSDKMQIQCWQGQVSGEFSYIFRSAENEKLELVNTSEPFVLASAGIAVSWVYNTNKRKGRWRVF